MEEFYVFFLEGGGGGGGGYCPVQHVLPVNRWNLYKIFYFQCKIFFL